LPQKWPCIENAVISLKPGVTIHLPSRFNAGPVADKPGLATIRRSDHGLGRIPGTWYRVHTIFETLSPLKNPVERNRHVVWEQSFDFGMDIDELTGPGPVVAKTPK
jgi:hypothetical protein